MKEIFNDADDWSRVQDPRKRKQIQDRLSQRARRRRLAAQRDAQNEIQRQSSDSDAVVDTRISPPRHSMFSHATATLSSTPPPLSDFQSRSLNLVSQEDDPFMDLAESDAAALPMTIDQHAFPTPQLSIYAALWDNGAMLGLSCCCAVTTKSKPVGPDIPLPLHPTPLQLNKFHFNWIDRFPFPRMRDNMITLSGAFDEEDFLEDLFKRQSFEVKPGGLSWDPAMWRIGKEFSVKWGYLFY